MEITCKITVDDEQFCQIVRPLVIEYINQNVPKSPLTKEDIDELIGKLKTPINDYQKTLSTKAFRILEGVGIENIANLVAFSPKQIKRFRGCGNKTFDELFDFVQSLGLSFGFDVGLYGFDNSKSQY